MVIDGCTFLESCSQKISINYLRRMKNVGWVFQYNPDGGKVGRAFADFTVGTTSAGYFIVRYIIYNDNLVYRIIFRVTEKSE